MTLVDFSVGMLLLAAVVVGVALAARTLRTRWATKATGPVVALADLVLGLALLVVVGELLGLIGLFERWPLAVASIALGTVAMRFHRPAEGTRPEDPSVPPTARGWGVAGAAAASLVVVQWAWASKRSLANGILEADSLSYHLPFAARFAQEASVGRLHEMLPDQLLSFHPATSELLHGMGMVVMRSDILSPVANLAWLGLALLASWCIGRPAGLGPQTMVAAAAVFASPVMWHTNAGSADNDIAVVALVLSAVALLLDPVVGRAPYLLAAVAAGLALGTKLSVVSFVGVLTLGALVATGRRVRLRTGAVWVAALVVTGGLWYVRNAVLTGNPVPALDLAVGPIELPRPEAALLDRLSQSVAHYASDWEIWRSWYLPGLETSFGPGWWAIVTISGAAAVAVTLRRTDRASAVVGVAVLVSLIGYVLTPTGAGGDEGEPVLFAGNLRYAVPALAVGLAMAPRVAAGWRRGGDLIGWAALIVFVLPHLSTKHWTTFPRGTPRLTVVVVAAVVTIAVSVAPIILRAVADHKRSWMLLPPIVVACLAVGWSAQQRYIEQRYAEVPMLGGAFGRDVKDARVGFAGFFRQYVMYGSDLSNRVEYIGRDGARHSMFEYPDCASWRQAINDGRFDYVVTAPPFEASPEQPVQAMWTRGDPNAREVYASNRTSVFRIDGPLDDQSCDVGSQRPDP